MPARTVTYTAIDRTTGAPKLGDAANHTMRETADGTTSTIATASVEVGGGEYKTTAPNAGTSMTVWGTSSTSGVSIIPSRWTNPDTGPVTSLSLRLAESPAAGFLLNELSGLTAIDITGNVAASYRDDGAGHLLGVTLGADGDGDNTAAVFDGVYGLVVVPDTSKLNFAGPMTLAMRVQVNDFPAPGNPVCLAGKGAASGANEAYRALLFDNSGVPNIGWGRYDGSSNHGHNTPIGDWQAGEWHSAVFTYTGTAWETYIDGVLTDSTPDGTGPAAVAQSFMIAAEKFGTADPLRNASVSLQKVFVYPTALSAETIAAIHAADVAEGTTNNPAAATWTKQQADFIALNRGQFVHYSLASFQPDENYTTLLPPNAFAPTVDPDAMIDQWLDVGDLFGARYAVLTASHGDGFRLYPSAQTTHDIAASSWYATHGNYDVTAKFITKCRQRGKWAGLYMSVVDYKYFADHPGYTMPQLQAWTIGKAQELAAYQPDIIWIDNLVYYYTAAQVSPTAVKAAIKAIAPNCLVIMNDHLGTLQYSDIASFEHFHGDPPAGNTLPGELCMTIYRDQHFWFDHDDNKPVLSTPVLSGIFRTSAANNCNVILNTAPHRSGYIPDAQAKVLRGLGGPATDVSQIGRRLTGLVVDTAGVKTVAQSAADKAQAAKASADLAVRPGDEVSLTDSERENVAVAVESHLLDEGDSQMLVNAIVGAIGNQNVDQAVLIAAVRADLERTGGKLALTQTAASAANNTAGQINNKLGGYTGTSGSTVKDAIEGVEAGGGSAVGPGASANVVTITSNGSPLADADVWITTDADGDNTIAGTLQTNSQGKVTFLLDSGVTYYLWMQKDGENPILGEPFEAD